MPIQWKLEEFGKATSLSSLEEVESFIRNSSETKLRIHAAVVGLSVAAARAVGETTFFEDARHVLDQVVKAKARIDTAAWHSIEVAEATASVLLAAQTFLDEQTIACTEWSTPREVAEAVLEAARCVAAA